MSKSTIKRWGTDSSGRGIYATVYMWEWWQNHILGDKRIKPFASKVTITQGAWMGRAGGGASASAGYHDGGGTFDLRVWNLTAKEANDLILILRKKGAAAWLRNEQHGGFSDPHIHFVLGSDFGLSSGARFQWSEYLADRDGLSSRGRDYHLRPNPIVTTPPPIKKPIPKSVKNVRKAKAAMLRAAEYLKMTQPQRKDMKVRLRELNAVIDKMPTPPDQK